MIRTVLIFSMVLWSVLFCRSQDTIFTIKGETILAEIIEYKINKRIDYIISGKHFPKSINDDSVLKVTRDRNKIVDLAGNRITKTSDGCYFQRDEMRDKRILRTNSKPLYLYYNQDIIVSFERIDSLYFLHVYYKNEDLQNHDIDKDGLLTIVMGVNSTIQLKSVDNYKGERIWIAGKSENIITVNAKYRIAESDIKLIAENAITNIMIQLSMGSVEHEIPKKFTENLQEIARCILITK